MTTPRGERRQFSRIRFDHSAWLRSPDGDRVETRVLDISLRGVLLTLPALPQDLPAEGWRLTLQLGEDHGIDMELALAHHAGGQAGFHCTHIDLESLTELRRLLELNLGDTRTLERELGELAAPGDVY